MRAPMETGKIVKIESKMEALESCKLLKHYDE